MLVSNAVGSRRVSVITLADTDLIGSMTVTLSTPQAAETTLDNMGSYFNAGGSALPLTGGTVTGATTFSAAGTAVTISNNATVTGVLTVNGAATGLAVKNSATVGGDLTVTGKFGANGKSAVGAQDITGLKLASDVVMASVISLLVTAGLGVDKTT